MFVIEFITKTERIAVKTKVLKWALAVFGIGLVAFFACKPSEEGYEGPLEFAVLQSGDYAGGQLVTDYYTVCRDYESYAEMWSRLSLPEEPEPMNFNAYSVLCIVDTLRPFPMYRIGVAGVNQTEDYVEVQVERTVDARVGSPVQAYALVRVPRISKDVKCVNLPFETGIVDPYMPELGTSECLMIAKEEYPEETFWFKFTEEGKLLEAQRIAQRTNYDMEMLQEVGMCKGIENYSAVLSGRAPGSTPTTLLDYFPKDFLLFVDESHVMLPQLRAMYGGDYARKKTLVDFGFRLPSAFDNRPLKFEEVESKLNQIVFVSATPGEYEREHSVRVAEQVIRPTGLLDPQIIVKPVEGQIEDLLGEINQRTARNERVLVTTLTKKMAEDLTDFLTEHGVKVKYMHHEVDTFERMELIKDLRTGTIDVIVGINLLREGLDLPEVSLVAILDADKEGFLRSETSLVQTIGRAARNADGIVIMYADEVTPSMEKAITETERRRSIQMAYNEAHGITPKTIVKSIRDSIEISDHKENAKLGTRRMSKAEREQLITRLTREMKEAAKLLEFEHAAFLRDRIEKLRRGENPNDDAPEAKPKKRKGKF